MKLFNHLVKEYFEHDFFLPFCLFAEAFFIYFCSLCYFYNIEFYKGERETRFHALHCVVFILAQSLTVVENRR